MSAPVAMTRAETPTDARLPGPRLDRGQRVALPTIAFYQAIPRQAVALPASRRCSVRRRGG